MTIPIFMKSVRVQFCLGSFFLGVDLILVGLLFDLSKSDWATWVGSIGTVGTLIGTILLATSERRNRRQQELALAQVTAASFVEKIRVARHMLEYGIATLKRYAEDPHGADLKGLHRINGISRMWTPADTVPLAVLHGRVAMKLSATCARFSTTQQNLLAVSNSASATDRAVLRKFILEQVGEYEQMRNTLDEVTGICKFACLEN